MPPRAKPKPKSDRPVTSSSTRFTRFLWFPLLPLEIRLIIYKFAAHHPRLIRARWTHIADETDYSNVYELSNFVKPGLLEACRESRGVALKSFDKVPHHVLVSGKRFCERDLWVNFAVDTFYFTNFSDKHGFLSALRKIAKYNGVDKGAKEKGIRMIAWDRKELWRLLVPRLIHNFEAPLLYKIVPEHTALREIAVVVKPNEKYVGYPKPHEYELRELDKPYAELKLSRTAYDPADIIPKALDCSFPIAKADKEQFERWKEAHPEWKKPIFTYKKVLKK